MNEEKTVSEQELDKVSGGTDGDAGDFEAAWAAYTATHCGNCGINYYDREQLCEYGKLKAAETYAATGEVRCGAIHIPCA